MPNTVTNDSNYENLNSFLYRAIKEMIWEQELKPGSKIKQEHVAERLGVSRTPLIKVLERLTTERMVKYIPRRGYFVKRLTIDEMLETFAVRVVLEGTAIKEFTRKATDLEVKQLAGCFSSFDNKWSKSKKQEYLLADQKFHSDIIKIANNSLIMDINDMFNISRFSYQKGLMRDPAETLSEHLKIIEKVQERDSKGAQLLMMNHLEKSKSNIAKVFDDRVNGDNIIDW